jgi:predicted nuclease with TOPRIM domain
MPPVFDETQPMAEIQSKEEAEKLSFIVDEMKCEKENLAVHNSQLQGKIQELNDALSNVKQARDTMEKSNLALLKESTRLKTEKEELLLKSSKPLVNTEPQNPIEKKPTRLIAVDLVIKKHKKHKKAKSRTVKPKAIKPIAAKKGDRGRPARVKKKVK